MRITEFHVDLISSPPSPGYVTRPADRAAAAARLGRFLTIGQPTMAAPAMLRQICAAAHARLGSKPHTRITSDIAENIALAPASAARLALIADELIANALIHAHPAGVFGNVEVRCVRAPGVDALLEVSDDGVGLPETFDPCTDSGRGLRLVRAAAEDLRASVRFNSGGCGLNVEVRVPAAR